jgi:uncharacterized protein
MRILLFFSHPAQFLFFKNPVIRLRENGHEVYILIKTKDILPQLLDELGWEYHNILPTERGRSKLSIIRSLFIRDIRVLRFARKNRIQLLVGTDASLAHTGWILRIPCITSTEDDYHVIRHLAWFTYPFTDHILAPEVCDVGKWKGKKIGYNGYMKLSYLHPAVFSPDRSKLALPASKPFFLIRLSGLTAHHDFGIKGIRKEVLDKIIAKLKLYGDVYISSEKTLPDHYEPYGLKIPVSDIHHYLYYSNLLICDSQSMAVEAAMLGTPSVRISSFAGRISVLEELEKKYHLTFGIRPEEEDNIFVKLEELLGQKDIREKFQDRRRKMLSEKIDVASFLTGLIDRYPYSVSSGRKKPPKRSDFTIRSYQDLLKTILSKGYSFQAYEDYIQSPAEKPVILRHDVDARPEKSLHFARLEHAMGIRGTYYFLTHRGVFESGIIKQIVDLGHEVGYHYQDLYLAKGNLLKAIRNFEQNLENLRRFYPVKTICMDGHAFSRWNNLDLWKSFDYRSYGIAGEPYIDTDFNKVLYLTDTGRKWNAIQFSLYDKVSTKFSYYNKSTFDLIRDLDAGNLPDHLMITTHPQRWFDKINPWLYEYGSQGVKNLIKFIAIRYRSRSS